MRKTGAVRDGVGQELGSVCVPSAVIPLVLIVAHVPEQHATGLGQWKYETLVQGWVRSCVSYLQAALLSVTFL